MRRPARPASTRSVDIEALAPQLEEYALKGSEAGPTEPHLSKQATAALMGVSARTIDRWCSEGCPHESHAAKRFRPSEVIEWADSRPASQRAWRRLWP